MKFLTKEDLIKNELKTDVVTIEGYGTIRVRQLSSQDRSDLELSCLEEIGGTKKRKFNARGWRTKIAALGMIDEKGNRLFQLDEWEQVGELPNELVFPVYKKIADISGMKDSEQEEEDEEGNLETSDHTEDSSSS